MNDCSYEELNRRFTYDHNDGKLTIKVNRIAAEIGKKCGWVSNTGYVFVKIGRKNILAHRIAWALFHKVNLAEVPMLDHIDGDGVNFRIKNLRPTSFCENNKNAIVHRSGRPLGVIVHKTGKWQAYRPKSYKGKYFGVRKYLGLFNTQEEASHAVMESIK